MALLSLQGVTLNLGGKTLLDTADLHVEQGERVCLVGRNGVGKSSLMALLSGDLTPDGDGHWLLRTETAGFAGVARFVAGLLDDVEVIDSPELKRYVADYFRRNASVFR